MLGPPDSERDAVALAEWPLAELLAAASARRTRRWGRQITYSPKVFLPLTNLCPDRCKYCSFRRSPGDEGEWTMSPDEVIDYLERGRERGCVEALFCLGDKPERAWAAYRRTLAGWGHASTVAYLEWAGREALARGLLPHTNAGLLDARELGRLARVNVSLGLMLESTSERLCAPGGVHHRAPDKRPAKRLAMLEEAGRQGIPFTTGILVGIGETVAERAQALWAIAAIHRRYGHIQEVIVQNFRSLRVDAIEPPDPEVAQAVAMARLILDDDISVQSPPNLNPAAVGLLLRAGINDFGGISPVTRDFINPRHPWPHIDALARTCAGEGFELRARLPVYDGFVARLQPELQAASRSAGARLA